MSTSGTYVYTVPYATITQLAMKTIGKLGGTELPTPQETSDVGVFTNMLCRQWMGRQDFSPGLKMWTRYRGDLLLSLSKGIYTLSPTGDNWAAGVAISVNPDQPNLNQTTVTQSANQNATLLYVSPAAAAAFSANDFVVVQLSTGDIQSTSCSVGNPISGAINIANPLTAAVNSGAQIWNFTTKGQPPLSLETVILRDSFQNDTPVDPMTLQEYEQLPTKAQQNIYVSDPGAFYYEPQLQSTGLRSGTLYLDVAGCYDVTKQLHIVGLRPLQTMVNPLDSLDMPEEWSLPVTLGTAKLIAPMFNAQWTKEMDDNMNTAIAIAKETTPETTAIYFQCHAEDQI